MWEKFKCNEDDENSWQSLDNFPDFSEFTHMTADRLPQKGKYPPLEGKKNLQSFKPKCSKYSEEESLAKSLSSFASSYEKSNMALAKSIQVGLTSTTSIKEDKEQCVVFTVSRDGKYSTTVLVNDFSLTMADVMKRAQQDKGSGVFSFPREDIKKLREKEVEVKIKIFDEEVTFPRSAFDDRQVMEIMALTKKRPIKLEIVLSVVYKGDMELLW